MTVYGEVAQRFRTAPRAVALILTTACLALIGAVLTPLLLSASDVALASAAGLMKPLFLHAPLATPFRIIRIVKAPLDALYAFSPLITSAGALLLSWLLLWFWPTEQDLATRLFVHLFCLNLVLWGCLAPALSAGTFSSLPASFGIPDIVIAAVLVLAGAWTAMQVQRKSVTLLGNLFPTESPLQRLHRWLLTIPLPFALLAGVAWLNGYRGGAAASGVLIAATLLEVLSHLPKARFEEIRQPLLREPAATLPFIAALLIAGSIFAFGLTAARRPPTVLVWTEGRVSRQPIERFSASLRFAAHIEELLGEKAHPELRIRWSKDRGKNRDVVLPKATSDER